MHITPIDKSDITIYIVATATTSREGKQQVNIITDQDTFDLIINASSIAPANATTAKDSPVKVTSLRIPVAIRHTEEGYLDLSAVNEGLITIERDGSFKDTPKLTALITALDARAAKLRAKLRTEGLDIMLDPTLTTFRDASMAYHAASIALEGLAEMLSIADRIQSNLVDHIETELEAAADELVATAKEMETLLAA
jgi:hypothetical protein